MSRRRRAAGAGRRREDDDEEEVITSQFQGHEEQLVVTKITYLKRHPGSNSSRSHGPACR